MSISEKLNEVFYRGVIPILFLCALFVATFAVTLSPQKAYAASVCSDQCTYDVLDWYLPELWITLAGNQTTLNGYGLSPNDAAPYQTKIDNARSLVQEAIRTKVNTPAWIATGNQAVTAAEAIPGFLRNAQTRSQPSQQINLSQMKALCNANDSRCDPQMQREIASLEGKIARTSIVATGGTPPRDCKALGALFDAMCWIRMISVLIGTLLISISALILAIADMLFNWTVDNTILLFSTAIFAKVADGVNVGWTAMRDIANIVIIGMFTFIAIATILGVQEYGAKKLLARVLVIAVLINFSLLFTTIIIDVSNFTAGQFYASATDTPLSQARDEAEARSKIKSETIITINDKNDSLFSFRKLGVSGAFIRFLGVTSVSDTYKGLDDIANKGGGWYVALGHGLLAAVLLGGAGLVLFYGVYLLISRAVLFIFLMITAAGAFATHLIPKMNDSEYGWNGWWSSLLHNATLAPILMILLYITLKVSESIAAKGGGTLGNLASQAAASAGTGIGALFSYLIILGLLWGSFLLASKWASKVGGLKLTGTLLSSAAIAPVAGFSRFIAAPLARKYIGGGAAASSILLEGNIKKRALAASRLKTDSPTYAQDRKKALSELTGMMRRKDMMDKLARGSFNVANVKPVQAGIKALGVPSFLTGQAKSEGFAGAAKARADQAIKAAEKLVLKKSDVNEDDVRKKIRESEQHRKKIRDLRRAAEALRSAAEIVRNNRDQQLPGLEKILKAAQEKKTEKATILGAATQRRNEEMWNPLIVDIKIRHDAATADVNKAEAEKIRIGNDSKTKISAFDAIIKDPKASESARVNAGADKVAAVKKQDEDMKAQDVKIKEAKSEAEVLQRRIKEIRDPLDEAVKRAETDVSGASGEVDKAQNAIGALNKTYEDSKKAFEEENAKAEKKVAYAEGDGLEEEVRAEVNEIIKSSGELAEDAVARKVHRRWANIVPRWFRVNTEENDNMTKFARSEAKKFISKLPARRRIAEEKAVADEIMGREEPAEHSPPAPAAPSAPPRTS